MKQNHMFLNDLFVIKKNLSERNSNKLSIQIQLKSSHEIFKGHFPGNPILPGVCMVQIMKEILMKELDNKLILNNADSIKFVSFINPEIHSIIYIDVEFKKMENNNIYCNGSFFFESVVFCRFKLEFTIIQNQMNDFFTLI